MLSFNDGKKKCCQLIGINQFLLMTVHAAARGMRALSVPGRGSETPKVINSRGGAEGPHDIQNQIACSSPLSFVN